MQTKSQKNFKAIFLLLVLIILTNGCDTMKAVKTGNVVKVDYIGTTEGQVFDTSLAEEAKKAGKFNDQREYAPLEFKVGAGQMIKGFDNAVMGMKLGEEKTVNIPPEEAYGSYNKQLVKELPIAMLEDNGIKPEKGQMLQTMTPQGPLRAVVKDVNKTTATLDFNHELAGKTLTFKIILKSIAS